MNTKEDEETENLGEYNIKWDNISDTLKQAIFSFDAGRVALILLREYPNMSVDEACDSANVLIRIYMKNMNFSDEVH